MKVTDSEAIKNGERELIDGINAELDWGVIEQVFREKHRLMLGDDIEFRDGDIVVHNNRIAYEMQFDVKVGLTLVVDREGDYLSIEGSEIAENQKEDDERAVSEEVDPVEKNVNVKKQDDDFSGLGESGEDSQGNQALSDKKTNKSAENKSKSSEDPAASVDWFDDD